MLWLQTCLLHFQKEVWKVKHLLYVKEDNPLSIFGCSNSFFGYINCVEVVTTKSQEKIVRWKKWVKGKFNFGKETIISDTTCCSQVWSLVFAKGKLPFTVLSFDCVQRNLQNIFPYPSSHGTCFYLISTAFTSFIWMLVLYILWKGTTSNVKVVGTKI